MDDAVTEVSGGIDDECECSVIVRSITQSLNPSGEVPTTPPGGLAHSLILVASI